MQNKPKLFPQAVPETPISQVNYQNDINSLYSKGQTHCWKYYAHTAQIAISTDDASSYTQPKFRIILMSSVQSVQN